MPRHRSFLVLKLFYFGLYGALGVLLPFLPLRYREIGLSEPQIGLIASLPAAIALFAAPAWSAISDALHLQRVLLPLGLFAAVVVYTLIGALDAFVPILIIVAVQAFVSAPVGPMSESSVLAALGEQRGRYGEQRMWGSVGWALTALLGGWLIAVFGSTSSFVAFFVLGLLTVLVTIRLPAAKPEQGSLRSGALKLARNRQMAVFLGSSFLLGCAGVALIGFRALFYQDIGLGSEFVGLADALGAATEIPLMFYSPRLLRRFSARQIMLAAPVAYVLVGLIQAAVVSPAVLLVAAVLRGVAFALFWTGGVLEAQRFAPAGMSATTQSLFGVASTSLAMLVANPISGWAYQQYGHDALFLLGTAVAAAAGVGLLWLSRTAGAPTPA